MKKLITLAVLGIFIANGAIAPAYAKKWTIYQRQAALSRRIDTAERANDLTLDEANNLRKKLSHVQDIKEKMLSANGGRLAYKDRDKLEGKLNKISDLMYKEKMAKRVPAR